VQVHGSYAYFTHRGSRKKRNEDALLVFDRAVQECEGAIVSKTFAADLPFTLMVADGLGGHDFGARASRLAVEYMAAVRRNLIDEVAVAAALGSLNSQFLEISLKEAHSKPMGCTIAGVSIFHKCLLVFNAGDSAVYQLHDEVVTLTVSDRVGHGRLVRQCLGGTDVATPFAPHLRSIELEARTKLILCTDGILDFVSTTQMATTCRMPSSEIAGFLVGAARQAGSQDDLTLIAVEMIGRNKVGSI